MDKFYRKILGLKAETEGLPVLEKKKGYDGNVAFVSDGYVQTHIAEKDLNVGFRTGQVVNPLERGHIAYRTDDLDSFKAHLDSNGIAYSDWKEIAVVGWQQIFFYDPDGNIIEVHEVKS
jgi:catechol 2,3-dioxygenase-like lactoylglutathione lyase family enzyme